MLASFGRLAGDMRSSAFSMGIVRTALTEPLWQTRLGLNIALFVIALLALHLAFGMACWLLAALSARACPDVRCSRRQWVLLWFLGGVVWLFLANATYFPHSSLGEPYQAAARARLLGTSPLVLITIAALATIAALLLLALRRRALRASWLAAGTVAMAATTGFVWMPAAHRAQAGQAPSVIILGVDSLRPDALTADTAPNILAFMQGGVQFTNAVTPLARTFPSWASILTGRHPHTTGAYMNLLPPDLIQTGTTLPQLLHGRGYRTYYAIDETRFSNIDASYGFDRTANPTIGGTDFVLAWFADTPLSNLVMNTRLGAALFPHLHGNRAAHVTYDPDTFVRQLERRFDFDGPTFLAAHLTLPHWPFNWATSPQPEPNDDNAGEMYREAVHRADQQVGDILSMLERRGVLQNALVVVVSDHGEALGQPDDLMPQAPPELRDTANNFQKWGHGSSVFSPHQYRVVFGIRAYGDAGKLVPHTGTVGAPVSLLDLAPTVLDLLHLESTEPVDGLKLTSLLQTGQDTQGMFARRLRFTESEYNPQGFDMSRFTPSALATAARIYRLDSATDRVTVRRDLIDWIISTRQYAVLSDDSFAAAVPSVAGGDPYQFVFAPGSGQSHPEERIRLRQALEEKFGIRFGDEATSFN